jgi:hypothetical protein
MERLKPVIVEQYKPSHRWCRDGNACSWRNCKFRHERCKHYDEWVKRGKVGLNCKSCEKDPDGTKSPEEGGCMYDHRDESSLKTFIEFVPIFNEKDLWDYFYERKLLWHFAKVYDFTEMEKADKGVLFRSLIAAGIEHEDKDTYIEINFPVM